MRRLLLLLLVPVGLVGCSSHKPSAPHPNTPPETRLFLVIGDSLGVPDTTAMPDTTVSCKILHWYGDDRDGEVIGYEWAWTDSATDTVWTFTTRVMDTFYVKIRQAFGYFTFQVRAIDDDSARDPTPARMTFPIINSPPWVAFPVGFVRDYDTAKFCSFNYYTFVWYGGDPDGDETVAGYEWYLGDSSLRVNDLDTASWRHLDSLTHSYTFTDLQPGCYRFFLRCYDIAGAYSQTIFYPDTTRGVWQVKEPIGNILYVDDNQYFYAGSESVFVTVLDSLYPGGYSTINFERRTFFHHPDIDSTLKLFDIVIYNAGSVRHLQEAASGLTAFVQGGGHLIMNVTYSSRDTVIYPYMPIDSIARINFDYERPVYFVRPPGYDTVRGYPDTTIKVYPDTLYATHPVSFTFGFAPGEARGLVGEGYEVLYVTRGLMPGAVYGDTVAVRFPKYRVNNMRQPAKVVLFSFAAFDCDGRGNFRRMLANVLQNEFN